MTDIDQLRLRHLINPITGKWRDGASPLANADMMTCGTLRALVDEIDALRSAKASRSIRKGKKV